MTVSVITEHKMVNTVTPAELVELMMSQDPSAPVVDLVDVRERDEWEAGHISGAVHKPLDHLAASLHDLDPDRMRQRLR